MRGGNSVVLGNKLTTLWEADDAIKKREERRGYNRRVAGFQRVRELTRSAPFCDQCATV